MLSVQSIAVYFRLFLDTHYPLTFSIMVQMTWNFHITYNSDYNNWKNLGPVKVFQILEKRKVFVILSIFFPLSSVNKI